MTDKERTEEPVEGDDVQADVVQEEEQLATEGETAVSENGREEENGREADEEAAEPTMAQLLEAAQEEAAKNLDGWQRAQAELSNARRRFEKQSKETYINATAAVVSKLLPVLDDFERAVDSAPDTVRADDWFNGITLVERKLLSILEGLNVKQIEAVGQPFDPNFHEAISQEPSTEFESGIVTRELQKGYILGERVVRAALVNVAE